MDKGWISLNRKILTHWMWQEKRVFSKTEAWLDILLTVNHTEKKVMIKNTLFIVKRGQSINSQLTWSKRWNWNRSKVKRFFYLLESDKMIDLKTNNKTTILTVCKYDSYQQTGTSDEHQMNIKRTSDEHQTNTNNNVNNINKENKENKKRLFLDFWETYPKKVAKSKCETKFNNLTNKDIKDIFSTINDFLNYKPFSDYIHPNPETYLNQRRWEDEVPKHSNKTNQTIIKTIGKTNQV